MVNELEYRSPRPVVRDREGFVYLLILKSLIGYLLLSSITLPFIDDWWIGELPVLALIQVPKVELANRVRQHVVMRLMSAMGWSRGSFSPDWIAARPWGLAIVYGLALGLVVGVIAWRRGFKRPYGRWILVLLAMALVDYLMTLYFPRGGFSIY